MSDSRDQSSGIMLEIEPHDSLPNVLERIRAASGRPVTITIPDHSPIFLTATEFRTLRDVADRSEVALTLVTEDRLRLQLASMFGLAEREVDPGRSANGDGASLPSSPSFSGWRKSRERHDAKAVQLDEEKDPIAESRRRRTQLYAPGVTADRASAGNDATRTDPQGEDEGALDYLDDTGSGRARLLGSLVAVLVVIALAVAALGWYYMPAMTVQATLREAQVGTEMLYSVTAPDANAPGDAAFSVPAELMTDTVEFGSTIPATGVRREPEDTASGSVTLRNGSAEAVTLPRGTTVANRAGIEFVTGADIEIPAGSPDGSTIGEASVEVTAAQPGSAGNLDQGELTGKVADQPIYFSNRDAAVGGGTDREIKVVAEADIDTLESRMESDLRRAVAEGWTAQLGEGRAVVGPSVEPEDPTYEITQRAGDVSDTVTLTGTVEATGLVYDLASVEERARESFSAELQRQIPDGYELDQATIALGEPELLSESPETVEYQVTATATARAVFDEGTKANLADAISGSSWSNVEATLANVPAFATWTVERDPGWWPSRAPQTSDRVTIEIAAATAAASPDAEAGEDDLPSPGTPDAEAAAAADAGANVSRGGRG